MVTKNDSAVIVLNDQGAQMDITYDKVSTLRSEMHGHPPCVLVSKESMGDRANDGNRV